MNLKTFLLMAYLFAFSFFLISCDAPAESETPTTVAVRTTLAVYPVGADISCLIVNNGSSDVLLYRNLLIECKVGGTWTELSEISASNDETYTIGGNSVFTQPIVFATGKLTEGRYRVTVKESGGGAFRCEFSVAADWDELPLTKKLQTSPFSDIPEAGSIKITVDRDYTLSESGAKVYGYTITNGSNSVLSFGEECWIEIRLENQWYLTPISGWNAVDYSLNPGKSIVLRTQLVSRLSHHLPGDDADFSWPDSKYRLVKNISDRINGTTNRYFAAF